MVYFALRVSIEVALEIFSFLDFTGEKLPWEFNGRVNEMNC